MEEKTSPSEKRLGALIRSPEVALPVGLAVMGLLAAPFYGQVMEKLLWMGESLKSLCGFG